MHKGPWQNDCTFCHSPFFISIFYMVKPFV